MNIGTYNTRTLSKDEKIDFLIQQLDKVNLDIIAINETKRKEELNAQWRDGTHMFLGAGALSANNARYGGVGFLIRPKFVRNIVSCIIVSARLGILTLKINDKTDMKIICCYAPTFAADDNTVEEFYASIEPLLQQRTTYTFICGDFNAKLGTGEPREKFIGNFGLHTRNHRGHRLAEFVEAEQLYVMNSFFKKRTKKRWTWESPNGITKNEIDFILTDCKRLVQDVETIGRKYFDTFSDHRPIRAKLRIDEKLEEKIRAKSNHKVKKVEINKEYFLNTIEEKYWKLNTDISIEDDYNHFTKQLLECKKAATTPIANQTRNRLSQSTLELLKKRKELKTTTEYQEYRDVCKELRKQIQQDYENYRQLKLQETVYAKLSLKKTEKELNLKQSIPVALIDSNGNKKTKRDEIENVVQSFYEDLFSSQVHIETPTLEVTETTPDILIDEVENGLKQMQTGKSPGLDKIYIDDVKAGGPTLFKSIAERFTHYLKTGKIPDQWKTSKTILLFKKGNPEDIQNYRPICLLSHLYKLMTRIILNRIQRTLEDNSCRDQAGFKRGYSTIDHIHTVSQLTEKCNEYQQPLCFLFIDFKKAFDTVEHNAVLKSLIELGVDPTYVRIIQEINCNTSTEITMFNEPVKINIRRGVRQGDVISPNLFTSTIQSMLWKIELKGGINIDGETLKILLFADDIILIAKTPQGLEDMLKQISGASNKIGLEVHPHKTQWMKNKYCRTEYTIHLNNTVIEKVDSYKYLGQTITMNNDLTTEIRNRKRAAWIGFNKIKDVLTDSKIDMPKRADLFNTYILSAMTYGGETWNTTKKEEESLRVTQRAIERRMCKISRMDHIKNTEIRERTKVKDVVEVIYGNKKRWAGHVARFKDNRWTLRSTDWYPRGNKRKRGRPNTRWEDPLKKSVGLLWKRVAQDRDRWKLCDLQHWRDINNR
ncbi:hypothetical protein M8J77_022721 [Diaphorina citri]|nr:hypothetical protein M8J77_022721 [Diaphorina citri]